MSLLDRIEQLEEQRSKLEQQKRELIDKRKIQIGDLAAKTRLLDIDDTLIMGAFVQLKHYIDTSNEEGLNQLKQLAAPFRSKRGKST